MTSPAIHVDQAQPVTLFTGQWVDLPLDEVARLAAGWGYDGLDLACSGEHLDIWRAAEDSSYLGGRRAILERHVSSCTPSPTT